MANCVIFLLLKGEGDDVFLLGYLCFVGRVCCFCICLFVVMGVVGRVGFV